MIGAPQNIKIAGARGEDIGIRVEQTLGIAFVRAEPRQKRIVRDVVESLPDIRIVAQRLAYALVGPPFQQGQACRRGRKRVVSGKSVSVRVDLGGRGIFKKKKTK